jgi:DNA-directed RNA polymerase sigma subunit (sigma70/sigma32)
MGKEMEKVERNALIVRMRHGFFPYGGMESSYEKIGKEFNISKGRVQQIYRRSQRILRRYLVYPKRPHKLVKEFNI